MIKIRCKAGDLVEVRSPVQIYATLDDNACLDGMPFMPEMLQFCGRRFRVAASAHKTCDSTHYGDGRLMDNAVFLEDLRCDGSAHGGCEANCLLFFKLAWLDPVEPQRDWQFLTNPPTSKARDQAWLRSAVTRSNAGEATVYRCQATEHLRATRPFKVSNLSVYLADIRSRNVSAWGLTRSLLLLAIWNLRLHLKSGWRIWTWLYKKMHFRIYGTAEDPHVVGTIRSGGSTPDVRTNLQAGDWVKVRSLSEIQTTLNAANRNRGLAFNPEMTVFANGYYRVERRVSRIVDEKTGRMLEMKGPCIMLEGVRCMARYHPEAILCPRRIPQYFREAWLMRIDQDR